MIKIVYDAEKGLYEATQQCEYYITLRGEGLTVKDAVEALAEDGRTSRDFYVRMEKVMSERIADAEAMLMPATAVVDV